MAIAKTTTSAKNSLTTDEKIANDPVAEAAVY